MFKAEALLEEARQSGALDLSCRQLEQVPCSVPTCGTLVALNLSCNSLHELPDNITSLQALEVLDVSYNQLHSLPSRLNTLSRLQVLNAAYNHLVELPTQVGLLPWLTHLHVNDNKLTQLPTSLTQLTSLQVLHVHFNLLTSLPQGLQDLPSLSELNTDGNPVAHTSCRQTDLPAQQQRTQGTAIQQDLSTSGTCTASPAVDVLLLEDADNQACSASAGLRCSDAHRSKGWTTTPAGRHSQEDWQLAADECVDVDAPGINILGDASDGLAAGQQTYQQEQAGGGQRPEGDGGQLEACLAMLATHTLDDLQDLPPACAAAMYSSLTAVQVGLQEAHEGRPLSRGGTAGPGAAPAGRAAVQSRGSILAGRPASSSRPRTALTGGSLSRPATAWSAEGGGWGPSSSRPGTAQQTRPGQLLSSCSLHNRAESDKDVKPSWMSGAPPSGFQALLTGHPRSSTTAHSSSHHQQQQSPSTNQVQSSQTASTHVPMPGQQQGGLAALPPVTFPLTAGVRSMLRQLSGAEGQAHLRSQHSVGSSGLANNRRHSIGLPGQQQESELGAMSAAQPDEEGQELQEEQLRIARQLLGSRKPELLSGLDCFFLADDSDTLSA